MQNNELKDRIILNIMKGMEQNMLSNTDLIEIIEATGKYLNLMTISDYARTKQISYNGVKHHREQLELFGVKYVIDNE